MIGSYTDEELLELRRGLIESLSSRDPEEDQSYALLIKGNKINLFVYFYTRYIRSVALDKCCSLIERGTKESLNLFLEQERAFVSCEVHTFVKNMQSMTWLTCDYYKTEPLRLWLEEETLNLDNMVKTKHLPAGNDDIAKILKQL